MTERQTNTLNSHANFKHDYVLMIRTNLLSELYLTAMTRMKPQAIAAFQTALYQDQAFKLLTFF